MTSDKAESTASALPDGYSGISPSQELNYDHQQWAHLLRYDASRRRSSSQDHRPSLEVHNEPRSAHLMYDSYYHGQTASTLMKPSKVRQMHVGDDLPHMPSEALPSHDKTVARASSLDQGTASRRTIQGSPYHASPDSAKEDGDKTQEDPYERDDGLTLGREVTPVALKGENAILVDRELQRLREKRPKEVRMKWRVLTGTMMLFVMGFTAYMVAQYVIAFLALSPSNWFLSDSQDGTPVSPDPLLRSIALLELIISSVALLGILASGFYLRMTRRRSCGRGLIWFTAIISTTLNVALSLANIALIVGWHKQYADKPEDPLAHTRDVGQRCNGVWDLDILWSAASSSLTAKAGETTPTTSSQCTRDSAKTLQMFLIAGGVRLAVFVILCSLWLICLGRYNRTTRMLDFSSNESINESPEMHKLLEEERGLPSMPGMHSVPGEYHLARDEDESIERHGDLPHFPESHYSHSTLVGAPPKLDRFAWQRGEASHAGEHLDHANGHGHEAHVYGNIGRQGDSHARDHSAGAWSTNIMDRLWGALWGSGTDGHVPVAQYEDEKAAYELEQHQPPSHHPWFAQWHARENTRLGVRGWFGRDASRHSFEEDEEMTVVHDQKPSPMHALHDRNPSQEKRAAAERHAAVRRLHDQANRTSDPYTSTAGLGSRSLSRKAAMERAEQRKQEQKDRIAFLASLGKDGDEEKEDTLPPLPPSKKTRRHSDSAALQMPPPLPTKKQEQRKSYQSQGDTLVAMPQLLSVPSKLSSSNIHPSGPNRVQSMRAAPGQHQRSGSSEAIDGVAEDDESLFWRASAQEHKGEHSGSTATTSGPVFVRQLGKLVRRLSAIESVGSGGERSQHQSRNSREPSSGSALY